jgi:hypothetical protein
MAYADGQKVQLGDRVRLGEDTNGLVVGIIETGEYLDDFSALSYLSRGVLIRFPSFGLIHYEDGPEADVELIGRK